MARSPPQQAIRCNPSDRLPWIRNQIQPGLHRSSNPGTTRKSKQNIELADTWRGALAFEVETGLRSHFARKVPVVKELVGFAEVWDWNAMRRALQPRNRGVGILHYLSRFESRPNRELLEA